MKKYNKMLAMDAAKDANTWRGIASTCAFIGAAILAYHHTDGWGWLVVAGIIPWI